MSSEAPSEPIIPPAGPGRWLAQDLADLLGRLAPRPTTTDALPDWPPAPDFDVLIIGSGYGGALAAAELAGCTGADGKPTRVGMLERGREYLPGQFPDQLSQVPTALRTPGRQSGEGLYEIRANADLTIVSGNGLGGGSLINAGVLETPSGKVFDQHWPLALRGGDELQSWMDQAHWRIGGGQRNQPNTIAGHADPTQRTPLKLAALDRLAGQRQMARRAAITVQVNPANPMPGGVTLDSCIGCGDCASGCNQNAKRSLDTGPLVDARRRGAEIYCGAEVIRVQRHPRRSKGWVVWVNYTDRRLAARQGGPVPLFVSQVILAAGAIGSTEILQRSAAQDATLILSSRLGTRISGNGDLIAASHGEQQTVNAIADPALAPTERRIGPTITGVIDDVDPSGRPLLIEEMAVPATLKRVFDEALSSAVLLRRMGDGDGARHEAEHPPHDPFAVDQGAMRRTQIFAAMGDDGADGRLRFTADSDDRHLGGHSRIHWPRLRDHPLFEHQAALLAKRIKASGSGGTAVANPFWKPVPDSLTPLFDQPHGPLLTVHPLGGCPMADDAERGVVNQFGQLYERGAEGWKPAGDFAVLDGSIVPGSLCANPALTISALSLRAVQHLRAQWRLSPPATPLAPAVIRRPRVPRPAYQAPTATEIEIGERLTGELQIRMADGSVRDGVAELTLKYAPVRVADLSSTDSDGRLLNPRLITAPQNLIGLPQSRLRLFLLSDWQKARQKDCTDFERDQWLDQHAQLSAPVVAGELVVFRRQRSSRLGRAGRSIAARLLSNGGLRELLRTPPPRPVPPPERSLIQRIQRWFGQASASLRLASFSGETRLFEYQVRIDPEAADATCHIRCDDPVLIGRKTLQYNAHSNPWRQLLELELSACPGMAQSSARLTLDPQFLVAHSTPLLHVVRQQDQVQALAELTSFAAYMSRMMLGLHLWNLGLPDAPRRADPVEGNRPRHGEPARPPAVNRLPGHLPGLPPPQIVELDVGDNAEDGAEPASARLSNYRPATPGTAPPVLFIHGYSASGTTFAHPAVPHTAARQFTAAGRDVWILDLRSSAGLPTASRPWMFEHMALQDIPCAVAEVCRQTGAERIDVVAHCMGAAMLSMAILAGDDPADDLRGRRDQPFHDRFHQDRKALRQRIGKLALSQVGPTVVFTPANLFRAYLLSTAAHYLEDRAYAFRAASTGSETLLDRLLATVPYPDQDYRRMHAIRPINRNLDWVGSRRRMDALYGITFHLDNMPDAVLDRLDDFFGPLHLDTVAQVLHFAQVNTITNRDGDNRFVSSERLRNFWTFDTLLIHGARNGLADLATIYRNEIHLSNAGLGDRVQTYTAPNLGHQDCWIGTGSQQVCERILEFLDQPGSTADAKPPAAGSQAQPGHSTQRVIAVGRGKEIMAARPWTGPILGRPSDAEDPQLQSIGIGMDRALGRPSWLVMLPVDADGVARRLRPEDIRRWPANCDSWHWCRWPRTALQAPCSLLPILIYPSNPSMERRSQGTPAALLRWKLDQQLTKGMSQELNSLTLMEGSDGTALDPQFDHRALAELQTAPRQHPNNSELEDIQLSVDDLQSKDPDVAGLRLPAGPDVDGTQLSLALGSCQYPPGLIDRVPAWRAYAQLDQRLNQTPPDSCLTDLLLLAGDQVYVDPTAGLLDPTQRDDRYNKPYDRWLSEPVVASVCRRMVMAATLDDHEIADNWEPLHAGAHPEQHREWLRHRHDGLLAHWRLHPEPRYREVRAQRQHTPGQLPRLPNSWQDFHWHGFPIFLADSRAMRRSRDAWRLRIGAEAPHPWLLGGVQTRELFAWLQREPTLPKLVVSASMLLPRHARVVGASDSPFGPRAVHGDGWDGYPHSLLGLLDHIGRHRLQHLVFLSGDLHLGCFARIRIRDRDQPAQLPITITSIHTAGLYRPFPFANAQPQDLLLRETMAFEWADDRYADAECRGNRRWVVEVEADTIGHAGFTQIDIRRDDAAWQLDCHYLDVDSGPPRHFRTRI